RRLTNVDLIDHLHLDGGNGVSDLRVPNNHGKKLFAFLNGELFGVVEAAQPTVEAGLKPGEGEDDSGCDHGTRQRTAAGFVNASHGPTSRLPEVALVSEAVPELRAHI